jgi:hypothetical protein
MFGVEPSKNGALPTPHTSNVASVGQSILVSQFFSSTVGIDEDTIKKHIEYPEKSDKGQIQLTFEFK